MARASTPPPTKEDPTVRYVKLKLGKGENEKTYSLAFDFNSLAVAEELTGVNLMQAFLNLGNLSAAQTRGLLYASVLKRHPEMTVEKLGDLLSFDVLPRVTKAIGEAIKNSMPDTATENAKDPIEPEPDPATDS